MNKYWSDVESCIKELPWKPPELQTETRDSNAARGSKDAGVKADQVGLQESGRPGDAPDESGILFGDGVARTRAESQEQQKAAFGLFTNIAKNVFQRLTTSEEPDGPGTANNQKASVSSTAGPPGADRGTTTARSTTTTDITCPKPNLLGKFVNAAGLQTTVTTDTTGDKIGWNIKFTSEAERRGRVAPYTRPDYLLRAWLDTSTKVSDSGGKRTKTVLSLQIGFYFDDLSEY